MGIIKTIYAHWRLNSMVRVWRKANKLLDKTSVFVMSHCAASQADRFNKAIDGVQEVFDEVMKTVEDKVITELKERV